MTKSSRMVTLEPTYFARQNNFHSGWQRGVRTGLIVPVSYRMYTSTGGRPRRRGLIEVMPWVITSVTSKHLTLPCRLLKNSYFKTSARIIFFLCQKLVWSLFFFFSVSPAEWFALLGMNHQGLVTDFSICVILTRYFNINESDPQTAMSRGKALDLNSNQGSLLTKFAGVQLHPGSCCLGMSEL